MDPRDNPDYSHFFRDVPFPAAKADLIAAAQAQNAPQDLIDQLNNLDDDQRIMSYNDVATNWGADNLRMNLDYGGNQMPRLGPMHDLQHTEMPLGYSGTAFDVDNPEEDIDNEEGAA